MFTIRPVYILALVASLYIGYGVIIRAIGVASIIVVCGIILYHELANLLKKLPKTFFQYTATISTDAVKARASRLYDGLREFVGQTSTTLRSTAAFVVDDIKTTVTQTIHFVTAVYKRVAQCLKELRKYLSSESGNTNAPDSFHRRYVFLVALRHGRSFEATKYGLAGQDTALTLLDWESTETSNLPEPSCFIRHFAVCLLPLDVWDSQEPSLKTKFRSATFWELIGPNLEPGEGEAVGWNDEQIESMDGVLKLGLTTYSNDAISESFYRPLREAWVVYDAVWWNCFDFAIRLAFMLMYDDEASGNLLRHSLSTMFSSRIQYALGATNRGLLGALYRWTRDMPWLWLLTIPTAIDPIALAIRLGLPLIAAKIFDWFLKSRLWTVDLPVWKLRNAALIDRFIVLQALTEQMEETGNAQM